MAGKQELIKKDQDNARRRPASAQAASGQRPQPSARAASGSADDEVAIGGKEWLRKKQREAQKEVAEQQIAALAEKDKRAREQRAAANAEENEEKKEAPWRRSASDQDR